MGFGKNIQDIFVFYKQTGGFYERAEI
jgi:hypothetical protein